MPRTFLPAKGWLVLKKALANQDTTEVFQIARNEKNESANVSEVVAAHPESEFKPGDHVLYSKDKAVLRSEDDGMIAGLKEEDVIAIVNEE